MPEYLNRVESLPAPRATGPDGGPRDAPGYKNMGVARTGDGNASGRLQQRLQLKLLSLIKLRKQCRLLVPFLFGEANPNPNLKP
jgi:hypothetical protein